MQRGQRVKVVDFEGKGLLRRDVAAHGDVLLVCKEKEFLAAQDENRESRFIDLKKRWVCKNSPDQR
jgi:hypothetical protein